jgi:hypothetical protein
VWAPPACHHRRVGAPKTRPALLVIIPGNPGDAVFYADFARALEAHGHEVLVTSHLTLLAPPASLTPYALHQVQAVTRHLASTGRSVTDVEVVLLGHSVGAYLAHLVVAQGLLPVSRVFMLCPFLTRPARSGRLLLRLVTSPLYARLLGLWGRLPARLQRWLVARSGAGPHAAWVQAALASPQPLAWAAMAGAEAAEIASRADVSYLFEEPLFRDPERFVALLARRDRWAPPTWSDRAGACLWLDGISHAFVVDPAQCQAVARAIDRRLPPARPPTAATALATI